MVNGSAVGSTTAIRGISVAHPVGRRQRTDRRRFLRPAHCAGRTTARDWLKLDAVTDAYRLVHSEGDGLSGLVVDRFGDTLVLEFFSAGRV